MKKTTPLPLTDKKFLKQLREIQNPIHPLSPQIKASLQKIETLLSEKKYDEELLKAVQDYWIPIANHFGMWKLRYRIEDELFKKTDPKIYKLIQSLVKKKNRIHKQLFKEITSIIRHTLKKKKLSGFSIVFRQKNLYGVFTKMQRKKQNINQLADFFALRIVVNSINECYQTLDALQALWPAYKERFKDYIEHPKANGYQSIHTTIHCLRGYPAEFQIRTTHMDQIAKNGPAAHGNYKRDLRSLR
jgi:(p)ppGpp synthase/HD superfamily hydrolase